MSERPSSLEGMKYVELGEAHVAVDAVIVECCGCGMPVDQTNERCLVMDRDAYMGTYGPCCAPVGRGLKKARRRAARNVDVPEHNDGRDDAPQGL